MDSSAPSGQTSDPFPSNRFLEWIGICIALLTLTLPLLAVLSTSSPGTLPGDSPDFTTNFPSLPHSSFPQEKVIG